MIESCAHGVVDRPLWFVADGHVVGGDCKAADCGTGPFGSEPCPIRQCGGIIHTFNAGTSRPFGRYCDACGADREALVAWRKITNDPDLPTDRQAAVMYFRLGRYEKCRAGFDFSDSEACWKAGWLQRIGDGDVALTGAGLDALARYRAAKEGQRA